MYSSDICSLPKNIRPETCAARPLLEAHEFPHSAGGEREGGTRSAASQLKNKASLLPSPQIRLNFALPFHLTLSFLRHLILPRLPLSQTTNQLRKKKGGSPIHSPQPINTVAVNSSAPFGKSRNGSQHTTEASLVQYLRRYLRNWILRSPATYSDISSPDFPQTATVATGAREYCNCIYI